MRAIKYCKFDVTIIKSENDYWWSAVDKESGVESFVMKGLETSHTAAADNFKLFAKINDIQNYTMVNPANLTALGPVKG